MATKARIGNQNPTQSVILPYKQSLYQKAIDTYEKSGRTAQEWQVLLTKHIYATNKDGLWTHTKFGFSLPRRNGKNEVVAIREFIGLIDNNIDWNRITVGYIDRNKRLYEANLKIIETNVGDER